MSKLLAPLKTRPRLAALGVVGVALCALPLVQLLRYQGAALDEVRARQQGLEPVAQTVALQRGLVSHRDLAGAVLRGRTEQEPARQDMQQRVDTRALNLQALLDGIGEVRARDEARDLRQDWSALSARVQARQLEATDSDAGHRLLIEQSLQVIDLVTLTAQATPDPAGPTALVALVALARLQADLAVAGPSAPPGALIQATQALQTLSVAMQTELQGRRQSLEQQRQAGTAALALLAMLGAGLLWAALRAGAGTPSGPASGASRDHAHEALDAGAAGTAPAPDGAAPQRAEAGRLLNRLRQGHDNGRPATRRDPSETLPPVD